MKKLYTLLLLVIGLTANAQDGDFDVLTYSIYTYGTVVNGGHAIEKTYRPTFDVTFVDGYWNYQVWNVWKDEYYTSGAWVNVEFIFNLDIENTIRTRAYVNKDGDLLNGIFTKEIEDKLNSSKVLHVRLSTGYFNHLLRFDVKGSKKSLFELKKMEEAFLTGTSVSTATFSGYEDEQDPIVSDKFLSVQPFFIQYVEAFLETAKGYGLDFSYIYDNEIIIRYGAENEFSDGSTTIAMAKGSEDDNIVHIVINKKVFNKMPTYKRNRTLFHELFHDFLNVQHIRDTKHLMNPVNTSVSGLDTFRMINRAFVDYANGKLETFSYDTKF